MSSTAAEARGASLRALDLLETLCGYAARGATNAELAKALGCSPHHVTRAAAVLIAKGWAKKDADTARFFPAPAFTRLVFRVSAEFENEARRLDDRRRFMTGE